MTTVRQRATRVLVTAVVAAAGVVGSPVPTDAAPYRPGQEGPPAQGVATAGGAGASGGDRDAEVLRAEGVDVVEALEGLDEKVRDELADLHRAERSAAKARAAVTAADERVAATEERIDELEARSDAVVVDAFVNPPSAHALDALATGSPADAAVKQSILDRRATGDADVLDRLAAAEAELDERRQRQEDAGAEAAAREDEAAARLAEVETAQSQQAVFVGGVEARLDRSLSEAEALARVDPATAKRIKARESKIAERLQEILSAEQRRRAREALKKAEAEARREAAARAPVPLGPATGGLTTVACPSGGSITVDSSLGRNLRSLLDAAAADGIALCGGGYRDPQEQIDLRAANCGSSSYAIYQAPSSSCSPPTARPGTSNHEQGLAVDFGCNGGSMGGRGSSCFGWLAANAGQYGMRNLPSEPWHWSVDGT